MTSSLNTRPTPALFIDLPAIVAFASRCTGDPPTLPGIEDDGVRRFMQMARHVDPGPMLLDDEFDLNFRFELFASMVTPLSTLTECYAKQIASTSECASQLPVYLDILTLTVGTLRAGVELFAQVRASAARSNDSVRGTVVDASKVFEAELSALLLKVTDVLDRADRQCEDKALIRAVERAAWRLIQG